MTSSIPHSLPTSELGRSDPIARNITLMQAQQFRLNNFDKTCPVSLRHLPAVSFDLPQCFLLRHTLRNSRRHQCADSIAVLEPELIRFTKGLPQGGIAQAGPLVSPQEDILQQRDILLIAQKIDQNHM